MIQVIQTASVLFEKLADKQPAFTGKGRMMKYVILQPVDNGFLLFNSMTCELILTDENFLKSETLREKWFVVPEDFDEKRLVKQLRPIIKSFHKSKGITSYTILTTTDCNARCFYCYEKGFDRIAMTQETAVKISSFIIENAPTAPDLRALTRPTTQRSQRPISINWFGGEPLYNLQVIDSICTELRKANVHYRSSMTSNCYLFTPEIVDKAKSLWNLKHVQVTLDGTEDVYNRIKAYIKEQPNDQTTKQPNDQTTKQPNDQTTTSPYQRVMRNIQLLLDADIRIDIRMNLDKHNAHNLMQLAEELRDRFPKSLSQNQNLSAYSHVLYQKCTHVSTEEDRPLVNAQNDRLNDKLMQYGMLSLPPLPKEMPLYYCMADNENALVFTPSGEMERCEHLTHADFSEREKDMELCDDCLYYPLCIRLKDCPEGTDCDEYIRSRHIKITQQKMLLAYDHRCSVGIQRKKVITPSPLMEGRVGVYQFFPLLDEYVAIRMVTEPAECTNMDIIHLNEIGKEIFEMYVSGKTQKQIVEALLEEYDASECEISAIVEPFIVKLSKIV